MFVSDDPSGNSIVRIPIEISLDGAIFATIFNASIDFFCLPSTCKIDLTEPTVNIVWVIF